MNDILPAYPLFVKDPYFSFWANRDDLTQADIILWTGAVKPMVGTITADSREFRFMGKNSLPALRQISRSITAFTTDYIFECELFELRVSFVSPLPLDDLQTLSCPVCRLSYEIVPKKKLSSVTVKLAVEEKICYSSDAPDGCKKSLLSGVLRKEGYEAAYIGQKYQSVLSHACDLSGADWGVFYLAGENCGETTEKGRQWIYATNEHSNGNAKGCLLIAFDDIASIYYYGQILRGYYFRKGDKNICDAIEESYRRKDEIDRMLAQKDDALKKSASAYGENYYRLCAAALRQSIGAHKLVEDAKGRILFLSKECNSDGCVATVDVTYPSSPLYLLGNPALVKGMLYPIFDFARMPVWKFDFAPHDAGVYPYVTGQLYAAKSGNDKDNRDVFLDFSKKEIPAFYYLMGRESRIYSDDLQMPVEESANMLLLCYVCYLADDDFSLIEENFDLLDRWGSFLMKDGPVYGSQLCTDDFAGHLAGNLNLAVKATVALFAYRQILTKKGFAERAKNVDRVITAYRERIEQECCPDGHLPLAFGSGEETYGLKYNLIFDSLIGAHIFSNDLVYSECACYERKATKYGMPLDSRMRNTKCDWILWCAALSNDKAYVEKMIDRVCAFLTEGSERYPFPDWYDVDYAKAQAFRNRTVVGGLFILLLKEKLKK